MGIPGFFGHFLSKEVREAIFNGLPPYVASLSFDLNGVFHEARKTVFGEGSNDPRLQQAFADADPQQLELALHNGVASIILRMIKAVEPRDCLILAVDGVAPGAKMQQQRGRRERSAKERLPGDTSFDRNAITPGTDFMIRLDNFMLRFIATYRQYLPPKVIYSSHLVPGEGEHKIMDYYRRGEASDGPAAKAGASHVLYGLDADLIMLSLLSPVNNIFLSRETVKEVVSIDNVKDYLIAKGKGNPSVIDDFVVIMFLLGNDFLPHTPALENMSESILRLLDIYAAGEYNLTMEAEDGRRSINWDSLKVFMQQVAALENELLADLSMRRVKYPSRFLQASLADGNFYPELFRSSWYQNALGPKGPKNFTAALTEIIGKYQPTEEDHMTNPGAQLEITAIGPVTPQRIEKMTMDYMRTMEWIYLYYREGTEAINQDWAYPYYHTPMLADLTAVMQTINVTRTIGGFAAYPGMVPFTALHQLVAVLPLKSQSLLPVELQPLFNYNSIIRDFFPDNFIIEMDGKNKDHEGVPIVPLIDRQRVLDAVAQISFTPERLKLWIPADEQFFVRTDDEAQDLARIQFDQQRHADFLYREEKARRRRAAAAAAKNLPSPGQQLVPTMTENNTAQRGGRGRGRGRGGRGGRGRKRGTREIPVTQKTTHLPYVTKVPLRGQIVPTLRGKGPIGTEIPVGLQVGKGGPRLTPIGTEMPVGLQVGKGGPRLTPIGTEMPVGLQVGKGGPRLTPIGTGMPVGLQVGPKSPTIAQTLEPKRKQVSSPGQWKQMTNLM